MVKKNNDVKGKDLIIYSDQDINDNHVVRVVHNPSGIKSIQTHKSFKIARQKAIEEIKTKIKAL